MKTNIYSIQGKEVSTIDLPEATFNVAWNANFMHDVVVAMQANARAGTANAKDRGAVSGGGKKPWRQKGTGRARHGSRRSPMWVGGGVAHGPTSEKDYSKKISRNARAKALASALSKKYADGEIIFVDTFGLTEPKTAAARAALEGLSQIKGAEALATRRKNAVTIVLPERSIAAEKSFANFGNLTVVQAKDVNVVDLLTNKFVIIASPDVTLETLTKRASTKQARKTA